METRFRNLLGNDQMDAEWSAWQDVCAEFKKICGDPNDKKHDEFFKKVRIWGEQLAKLRRTQSEEIPDQAIAQEN